MQTVATLIKDAPLDRVDTRVLLQYVLRVDHAWLIAHADEPVNAQQAADFLALVARRIKGEPVAYLTGEREFYGLTLRVTPDVLIPRPDSELLVDLALDRMPPAQPIRIVDLGTGSGAIAIAIAKARPFAHIYATDESAAALAVAQTNAKHQQVTIHFSQGHWFADMPRHFFDLIVSNPPYIKHGDLHLLQGDLRFEPRSALTDESVDGLDDIRYIVRHAARYLTRPGTLLLEHGYDQAQACCVLLQAHQFKDVQSFADLAGIARVSMGTLYPA
jgi:release factor glutamine methyltransferase